MKSYIIILYALILVYSCNSKSTTEQVSKPVSIENQQENLEEIPSEDTENADISQIQKKYNQIQQQIQQNKIQPEITEFTCQTKDGHGVLHRFIQNNQVIKISFTEGIGHSYTTEEFFFDQDQLFFVLQSQESWSPSAVGGSEEDPASISTITEKRFYVKSDTIIKKLEKTYKIHSHQENIPPDQIPNQEQNIKPGEMYDSHKRIEALKMGKIEC
ncbi:MAG: hypothetical protein Q4G27_09845 [Flavobacteriaceae bacterium]|nr:hypothetical protein [Flavobacteriaceae bacterium]